MAKRRRPEHLIIQTAFLGDLLLSIPLLRELRRISPDHQITVLCRKGLGGILLKSQLVDEVIEADKSSKASWQAAVAILRSRSFDWVLCPHESLRSALLVMRLKANLKVGYRRFFNRFIFDQRIPRPMELPEALRQLALLEPMASEWGARLKGFSREQERAGGQTRSGLMEVPSWAEMRVPALLKLREEFKQTGQMPSASTRVQELIEKLQLGKYAAKNKIVFLAPGSVWPTKMWTEDGFVRVAREMLTEGYQVVLMGSAGEKAICDAIAEKAKGARSIAGETALYESAELLSCGDLLIGNDSGSMHMAAAAGVPSVSIFGPTVLEFGYRPWQNEAHVVQVDLKCRPCGSHGAKKCPLGTHECMKRVSPEMVLTPARDLLGKESQTSTIQP